MRNASLYSCDDAFERHAAMVRPEAGPTLRKVTAMDVGERLAQPIDVQVEDVFRLCREEFPLVARDVAAIAGAVVVEGAAVLPELLAATDVPPGRAVWLVPTERFQRLHYRRRTWPHDLLASVADPARAFDRWMRRDAAFGRLVAAQARDLGYPVIIVDGTATAAGVAATVDNLLIA
jgi:hypothetical protein